MTTDSNVPLNFFTHAEAVEIARNHQADAETAAHALEDAGCDYHAARRALGQVFGYDVLARKPRLW